jgi:hypothetical protein
MKAAFFSILLFTASVAVQAGVIVLEGKYQNKNIYVQNSISSSGVGYCAYEVRVNGSITTDEINSTAFEIDLAAMGVKFGDNVVIQIKHKDGCAPKILNPEALKPKPTFDTKNIMVDQSGLLKWTTSNEQGPLPFVVEQFRWNKWIAVGEVSGKGTPEDNSYQFQVTLHSGENKFRVKQTGVSSQTRYSTPASITSGSPKVEYVVSKNNNVITFTSETLYEVYDYYGTIVKKGFGKLVDMSNLVKGGYYLCYDNVVTEFKKK